VPLTLTPIDHLGVCSGWRWEVADELDLARKVAMVALGQYRHVARILAGINRTAAPTRADTAAKAIEHLTVGADGDPSHRDGWVFQTISWIAAHRSETGIVARAPHAILAHKGFDGMQLRLDAEGSSVTAVVIFEDKATIHPRRTIRNDVWSGIRKLEKGDRMPELIQETTTLLEAHQAHFPALDIDDAVEKIIWKEARHYRVSITTSHTHVTDARRKNLFKGFEAVAPGLPSRRQADTMHLPELRQWMASFSALAIEQIKEWRDNV